MQTFSGGASPLVEAPVPLLNNSSLLTAWKFANTLQTHGMRTDNLRSLMLDPKAVTYCKLT